MVCSSGGKGGHSCLQLRSIASSSPPLQHPPEGAEVLTLNGKGTLEATVSYYMIQSVHVLMASVPQGLSSEDPTAALCLCLAIQTQLKSCRAAPGLVWCSCPYGAASGGFCMVLLEAMAGLVERIAIPGYAAKGAEDAKSFSRILWSDCTELEKVLRIQKPKDSS